MFDISDMVFIAVFRLSQPISITEIERLVDLRGRFGPCLHISVFGCAVMMNVMMMLVILVTMMNEILMSTCPVLRVDI